MRRFRDLSLVRIMKLGVYVLAVDLAATLIVRPTVGNDGVRLAIDFVNLVVLAIAVVLGGVYLWRRTLSSEDGSRLRAFTTNLGAPLVIAIAVAVLVWVTRGGSGAKPVFAGIAAFCIYQAIASYLRNRNARRA